MTFELIYLFNGFRVTKVHLLCIHLITVFRCFFLIFILFYFLLSKLIKLFNFVIKVIDNLNKIKQFGYEKRNDGYLNFNRKESAQRLWWSSLILKGNDNYTLKKHLPNNMKYEKNST
jgi:hypothetical protein